MAPMTEHLLQIDFNRLRVIRYSFQFRVISGQKKNLRPNCNELKSQN